MLEDDDAQLRSTPDPTSTTCLVTEGMDQVFNGLRFHPLRF